jgi:hypothetical protein
MPNQNNFVQVIPNNPRSFPVSRIAESDADQDILEGRLPGQFGFDADDTIEMHFYDTANSLVGSVVIPVSTGIISAKTIALPDGTTDEKVIIDMTRVQQELGLLVPPGNYNVSINFFSDEIGSYTDPKMIVEEVSPSRTELRLGFTNNTVTSTEQGELFEFVQPAVPRVIAAGLVADTLGVNQQGTGVEINPEIETLIDTSRTAIQGFIDTVVEQLIAENPDIIGQLADLQPDAPENLNFTIEFLVGSIYDEVVALLSTTKNSKQFDRLQEDEMTVLLTQAIDNVLKNTNLNLYTQDTVRYETNLVADTFATSLALG